MNLLVVVASRCPSCCAEHGRDDRFCRRCGASILRASETHLVAAPTRNQLAFGSARQLAEHRLAVLGLLLVVGPLGLPFLWLSSRFSRPTKIVATVAYFGLTVVAPLAAAWYWLEVAVRPLLDVFPPRR